MSSSRSRLLLGNEREKLSENGEGRKVISFLFPLIIVIIVSV